MELCAWRHVEHALTCALRNRHFAVVWSSLGRLSKGDFVDYKPAVPDTLHILLGVLDAGSTWRAINQFAEVDDGLASQVLEEAAKFVAEQIAPLRRAGDEIGARFEAGREGAFSRVVSPTGFRKAYEEFWQAGWPAVSCAVEDGGQGLPWVLEAVIFEWLSGANHGWTMAPGLLHGAYECLKHHGSRELQERYLRKIASGEWLATMCLTEPHAGSDLGLIKTKATSAADGSYRLSGGKIFISGGDHDLSENIVHLVLARLPNSSPGPKGLSLFLVPKLLPDGKRNTVHCDRIEEKMGLHGSPTCAMRFDEACAWLIGEPGRGLNAMFVMMNAARLHVALQGVGLLDAAWQIADAYARERRQMRVPRTSAAASSAGPDLIVEHPAVRRLLQTQRVWIDGGRLLAYRTGVELDVAKYHPQDQRRSQAIAWCSLVTPVLKAALTQQAFFGASECMQVLGGHGYIREWGIEQIVRDARVAMIYEGTNEIQAIDLLIRKVLPDSGRALGNALLCLRQDLDAGRVADAAVIGRFAELRYLTAMLCEASKQDGIAPYEVADDYLRAVALALLSWAWARISAGVQVREEQREVEETLRRYVLPEFDLRVSIVRSRCNEVNRLETGAVTDA